MAGAWAPAYKVQASMLEVYLESIYDLLNSRERLAARGSLETGFYVPGPPPEPHPHPPTHL